MVLSALSFEMYPLEQSTSSYAAGVLIDTKTFGIAG